MRNLGWIIGVIQAEHSYHLNDVSYIVRSRFEPPKEGRSVRSAFQKLISGDMVDLMALTEDDKLTSEYVCSAAGKED